MAHLSTLNFHQNKAVTLRYIAGAAATIPVDFQICFCNWR
jgi:hypothetical protein